MKCQNKNQKTKFKSCPQNLALYDICFQNRFQSVIHISTTAAAPAKKKFQPISTDSTVCWRTCCDGRLGPVRVGVLKRKAFLGKTLFCQQKNKFSSILYRARTRNRPKPICYSLSKVGLTFLLGTLGKSGFFSWWERNYKSQVKNL